MAPHGTLSAEESADRLAIRELVDSYAHCADRRDAKGQMALFTVDAHFVVYMDAASSVPSQELHGRESLASVFENLNTYRATTHFNGQSTISLSGARATGESYCLAHHVLERDDKRSLMIAAIRYIDSFEQLDGVWYFAERVLFVDWMETRELSSTEFA
jgi:ketosteroid isomerase-like protein